MVWTLKVAFLKFFTPGTIVNTGALERPTKNRLSLAGGARALTLSKIRLFHAHSALEQKSTVKIDSENLEPSLQSGGGKPSNSKPFENGSELCSNK